MKIFYSFLIIICSVILILLPINQGVYDYKNAQRQDHFTVTTAATTNSSMQLFAVITANDTNTIKLSSDNSSDVPLFYSYNGSTRLLTVTGLAQNTTRSLSVQYDTPAITNKSMVTFLNIIPWVWVFIWVMFPLIALVAMWKR